MHATNRVFSRLYTLFSYNFLGNGPIKTIFGMYIGIDSRNIGEINLSCKKM